MSDRSVEIKNNFKSKSDRFKKTNIDKLQNDASKTQEKRIVKFRKTNNEINELQEIKTILTFRSRINETQITNFYSKTLFTIWIINLLDRKASIQINNSHNFSSNNLIDYVTKRVDIEREIVKLKNKRKYKIAFARKKRLQKFIIEEKLESANKSLLFLFIFRRRSKDIYTKNEKNFESDQSTKKREKLYEFRFNFSSNYLKKNAKELRNWKRIITKKFVVNFKYFSYNYVKIIFAQKNVKNIVNDFWKARKKRIKKKKQITSKKNF